MRNGRASSTELISTIRMQRLTSHVLGKATNSLEAKSLAPVTSMHSLHLSIAQVPSWAPFHCGQRASLQSFDLKRKDRMRMTRLTTRLENAIVIGTLALALPFLPIVGRRAAETGRGERERRPGAKGD